MRLTGIVYTARETQRDHCMEAGNTYYNLDYTNWEKSSTTVDYILKNCHQKPYSLNLWRYKCTRTVNQAELI